MDSIQILRTELRGQIQSALMASIDHRKSIEKLEDLFRMHPDCAELALFNAVKIFYLSGGPAGICAIKAVLERSDALYSVGCLDEIKLASIREMANGKSTLSARDFSNFIFLFHLVGCHFGRQSKMLGWLKSEFSKRHKQDSYQEMFYLRNLLYSLQFISPDKGFYLETIRAEIEKFDKRIIQTLRELTNNYLPRKRRALSRIVICSGLMKHGATSMHARLVMDYARNLAAYNHDIKILILVTNELPFLTPSFSFAMGRAASDFGEKLERLHADIVSPDLADRVSFEFMPLHEADFQDILKPIERVIEFDPDVMMHYGEKFHNESFFLRRVLFDRVPTAYFFTQMINRVDQYNDIYLARNDYPLVGVYEKSKVRIAPPPVRSAEMSSIAVGKRAVDFPAEVRSSAEDVILISALAGDRMERKFRAYSQETRNRMMDLLERDGVKWIWVGPADEKSLLGVDARFIRMHQMGRLEVRKFEKNLMGLMQRCDIFLHLPAFTGGGGGMSIALREALPVLCFENTDAAVKVYPEFVFSTGDQSGFFERATKLIESAEDRKVSGRKCLEFYQSTSDLESLVEASYSGLRDAISAFNVRLEDVAAH